VFEAVRNEFGPEIPLLHDAHHRLTPIQAAALQLGMAIPNFGIQEYMKHSRETDEVFRPTYSFADGMLSPGEGPGLGVEYDDLVAGSFPYQAAHLPVNRLTDGSMHDW
jgi:mannonate dehydratase